MDFDFAGLLEQLKNLDTVSVAVGAVAFPIVTKLIVKAITPIPGFLVRRITSRIKNLHESGKIDAPTLRLLNVYANATFAWIDAELPDNPGPEKMNGLLDQLSRIPYIGAIVRADRKHSREILQAFYESIDSAAKDGFLETSTDDENTSKPEEEKEKTQDKKKTE